MKDDFLKTLSILQPYLDHMVIIGGWAVYIYHYYYASNPPPVTPLGTLDIDFAVQKKIPLQYPKSIDQLLIEAGYKPILGLDANPPAVKYKLENANIEIEFITNQKGNERRLTEDIQGGLGAQKLKYINILPGNCIYIKIIDSLLNRDDIKLNVKVPHPGRFIFQKILASNDPHRRPPKSHKDIYYAFDLIANYHELYNSIVEEINSLKTEFPSWYKRFVRILSTLFESELSDGPSILLSQSPTFIPSNNVFRLSTYRKMQQFIKDIK